MYYRSRVPGTYRGREKFRAISITFVGGPNGGSLFSTVAVDRWNDPIPADQKITAMPANKGNLSTPHKEKPGNGLTTGASKKKKRCTVKHKRHCKQYLVSERNETLISLAKWTAILRSSRERHERLRYEISIYERDRINCKKKKKK